MQAWTEEGCLVGTACQVAEVTKPSKSVSNMGDAGNVVTLVSQRRTSKNLWRGATTQFGRESARGTRGRMIRTGGKSNSDTGV